MLLMKKKFFAAVRDGRKTTTLRYWKSPRVRPGALHTVPGLGKVLIGSVEPIEPGDITDELARADGFADAAALRAALDELYPADRREGRRLYLVAFRLVRPGRPAPAEPAGCEQPRS